MTPDSESFEQLRRLLALNRHEQPPPGYFNNFSSEVIARIKTARHQESAIDGISWLQRFWMLLEGKPAMVGALGAAVCGLLVAGVLNAERGGVASSEPAVAGNFASFPGSTIQQPANPSGMQPVVMIANGTNPM